MTAQKPYPQNRAEPDADAPLMPPTLPPQTEPAMALVYAGPEILSGVACPSCGAMNEAGSKFCMNCGTKLP